MKIKTHQLASYDFKKIERKIIATNKAKKSLTWSVTKDNFFILMPPPNITGSLHIGHALNNFIQDVLVRTHKLAGKNTVWIPGFDHAGIATEIVVKKWIKANNYKITSQKMMKEYFQKWAEMKKMAIENQWEKLGLMINLELKTFTLDEEFIQLVKKTFVQLYQEKLIYQAKKLVNFDLTLQTAISDAEVVYKTQTGQLYYIKYWAKNHQEYLVVATTRPETIFADQALAIHPQDQRYQKWIGRKVINPLTKEIIPIITSKLVKKTFGTGVLKCTPGHDFKDWIIGQKHNLKAINCFTKEGKLTKLTKEFSDQTKLEAKKAILVKLTKEKLLLKEEKIVHQVPYSIKSETIIEPMLSQQWFIKTKIWAEKIWKEKKMINFIPTNFQKIFLKWVENCQDWCISRQLSWGHQLPVYYNFKKEILVSATAPVNKEWKQSQDVLDTWFSSGLWSLFHLAEKKLKKANLPSIKSIDYLVTSYDIIFFWVTRMLFLHYHFKKEIPFQKILIHGLIRTSDNQKMSKSKGNAINPEVIINQYGVDSLRFYLLANYKIGQDLRFEEEKLIQSYQFCNKLWNIHLFINQYFSKEKNFLLEKCQEPSNIYIIKKWQKIFQESKKNFANHLWTIALQAITEFVWKDFSNFYLVLAKELIQKKINKEETIQTINWLWEEILLLLHPYLPFLTQYCWEKKFLAKPLLINEEKNQELSKFSKKEQLIDKILQIKTIIKQEKKQNTSLAISTTRPTFWKNNLLKINLLIKSWGGKIKVIKKTDGEKIQIIKEEKPEIIAREIAFLEKEMVRSKKILTNQLFLKNAQKKIVHLEKTKAKNNQKKLIFLKEIYQKIKKNK